MPEDVCWPATCIGDKKTRRLVGGDDAAAALTAGASPSISPKRSVNEDSVGLFWLEDGSALAVVADSHWGAKASELVVSEARAAFEGASGEGEARLGSAIRAMDQVLWERRLLDRSEGSETTALLVSVQEGRLSFVSVGDSLLYLIRDGVALLLNEARDFPIMFMGQRPLEAFEDLPLDGGDLALVPGDVVVLATDGLEPPYSGLMPEEALPRLCASGRPLREALGALLDAASDAEAGTGRDNIGLVALRR